MNANKITAAMPVYVPSSSRYQLYTGTLSRLPSGSGVYLVVQDKQAYWYEPVAEQFGVEMLVLPKGIERIAPTRLWIGQHAERNGFDKHCQIDDDLYFRVRHSGGLKTIVATKENVHDMLMAISWDLEQYAHVGVSNENGNNRQLNAWALNTRYMRVLGYQTDEYLRCEHGRVEILEDFDVALQMLRRGLPSKVHYHWTQGQGRTNGPGGCRRWRTLDLHNENATRLSELHPDVVRLRQKNDNNNGGGFGKRLEVTVQWKKAYHNSVEAAA